MSVSYLSYHWGKPTTVSIAFVANTFDLTILKN